MDKTRINLSVDEDIPAILERLAGGRNKMGDWLSAHLRSIELDEKTAADIMQADTEQLRLVVQSLAGRVRSMEAELERVTKTVAALIADVERCNHGLNGPY